MLANMSPDFMDVRLRNCLAAALNGLNRFKEALAIISDDLAMEKGNTFVTLTAARSLKNLGRLEESLDLIYSIPKHKWDKYFYDFISGILSRIGRFDEAIDLIKENLPKSDWDSTIRYRIIDLLYRAGRDEEIQDILNNTPDGEKI